MLITLSPRDATQNTILPRQVVAPSVRLSVHLSMWLMYRDHIGCNSSKIISPLVSPGCSLSADPDVMDLSKGTPLFRPE